MKKRSAKAVATRTLPFPFLSFSFWKRSITFSKPIRRHRPAPPSCAWRDRGPRHPRSNCAAYMQFLPNVPLLGAKPTPVVPGSGSQVSVSSVFSYRTVRLPQSERIARTGQGSLALCQRTPQWGPQTASASDRQNANVCYSNRLGGS